MIMQVLVVDDELPARERLANMLKEIDVKQWHLAGTAENGQQAVDFFSENPVDVVLMDIRMPVMDGLQAAARLAQQPKPPAVIFTTAYNEYALEAFDVNGTAYLLKPVKKAKLLETLERIQIPNRAQLARAESTNNAQEYIAGNYRGGVQRVSVEDIVCFQAEQKYVMACTAEREILLDMPLKSLEEKFAEQFIRVHRNALAARQKMLALEKNTDGQAFLIMQGTERKLEVSRRHLSQVKQYLRESG